MDLSLMELNVFDFYPDAYLIKNREKLSQPQLDQLLINIQATNASNCWDTSILNSGDKVITPVGKGSITDWHTTDTGLKNGGYQVLVQGNLRHYYVTQLKKDVTLIEYLEK